jgi:hypothetical protein
VFNLVYVWGPDLIGFQSMTITPEMVGRQVAIFTAIEVKTDNGKVSPAQTKFIDMVRKFGGIVRSVADAITVLNAPPLHPAKK